MDNTTANTSRSSEKVGQQKCVQVSGLFPLNCDKEVPILNVKLNIIRATLFKSVWDKIAAALVAQFWS